MLGTCIILNGPPGSGKDTIANLITSTHGFHKCEFKEALYRETIQHFQVDRHEFMDRATDREFKERPWEELEAGGKVYTPREALIHVSENIIKINEGEDYFGVCSANMCTENRYQMAVFADGGFATEIPPIQAAYQHTLIIRLHRPGYSFDNDSRKYIEGFDNSFDIWLVEDKPELAVEQIFYRMSKIVTAAATG